MCQNIFLLVFTAVDEQWFIQQQSCQHLLEQWEAKNYFKLRDELIGLSLLVSNKKPVWTRPGLNHLCSKCNRGEDIVTLFVYSRLMSPLVRDMIQLFIMNDECEVFQRALCSTLTWAFISSLWWFSSVDCHLYATRKDNFWRWNQYLILSAHFVLF